MPCWATVCSMRRPSGAAATRFRPCVLAVERGIGTGEKLIDAVLWLGLADADTPGQRDAALTRIDRP